MNDSPSRDNNVSRRDGHHQSEIKEGDIGEDRKHPTLPASVVAIHVRNQKQWYSSNTDDNRSLSSQKSESGYYSSGALSDGPPAEAMSDRSRLAAYAPLTSVGSVGSHGSIGGRYENEVLYAFAISSYAASEAAKSDIATVCSGSVIEDIEFSSLDNMNVAATPNNVVPSPHSEKVVMAAGLGFRRSVEFAPSAFNPLQRQQITATTISENRLRNSDAPPPSADQPLGLNDMGPPLSRALLMQRLHSATGSTTGSRAGSVRSFGSNGASQNSDVVAHVDTDDCGGSLVESITDGQSVHSQEDIRSGAESEPVVASTEAMEDEKEGEEEHVNGTHPLLKSSSSTGHRNGRTSPGGTIYKGKGVRRYQGRYMNLPLKRFHQDSSADLPDTILEADKVMEENKNRAPEQRNRHGYDSDDWPERGRTPSPRRCNGRNYTSPERGYRMHDQFTASSRSNAYHNCANGYQKNGYYKNGYNNISSNNGNGYHSREHFNRSRSRSRSDSRSPSPKRRNRRRRNAKSESASPSRNRRDRSGRNHVSTKTGSGHSPRRRGGKRSSRSDS